MPGIQDIYSINVSNRYELSNLSDSGDESDSAADYDPLDTLRNLEDEKKRALEEAKKKKQAVSKANAKSQKKSSRFQEIKESNVPEKKEAAATKPPRSARQREDRNEKPRNARRGNADRQNYPEGDENRRPPRRRNDQAGGNARSGQGDQITYNKEEQQQQPFGNYGRQADDAKPDRRERSERYHGGRGGHRNFGGGFRGRGYSGYRNDGRDDRGKREFDRHSGSDRSGVRPTDKREGAGPRNWGTPGKELEESVDVLPLATEEVGNWQDDSVTEEKEGAKDAAADAPEEKEPKEEEAPQMTLDEWKAKQASQPKNPSFNLRKAGEGENVEQWKDMKLLKKTDKAADHPAESGKEHKRQAKQQVNLNIQFGDNAGHGFGGGGGGRGRGGRGGGRGRGGRGGGGGQRFNSDRPQRGHQMMPDVLNEAEFPTLG